MVISSVRYLHETDAILRSGDKVVAATARQHTSRHLTSGVPGYNPSLVYVTDITDREFGGSHLGNHGQRTYVVEPVGKVGPDPEVEHWKRYYAANPDRFAEDFGAEDGETWHDSNLGHALSARTVTAARVVRVLAESERIL